MFPVIFNSRTVRYSSTKLDNWQNAIPFDNWCLVLISNEGDEKLLKSVVNKSIDNNVGYICGIGNKHEFIHNYSDFEFTRREIEAKEELTPKYHIMTVGDDNFEEGIWFGLFSTFNPEVEINFIQIIDETGNMEGKLLELIKKFDDGYIPEES